MLKKYAPIAKIYVRALGGDKQRGIMQAGNLRLPCALGRGGISARKREGDRATPRAKMRIVAGFRQNHQSLLPVCGLKLRRIRAGDGWCDAPGDANYNRPVRLPYKSSAEPLARADNLYNIVFVLDWNMKPRIKGRGSAIFLHLARAKSQTDTEARQPGRNNRAAEKPARRSHATRLFHPTAGCIALPLHAMRRLMPLLQQGAEIIVLG
ncbi:L,D-transpeptidase family protein [Candidatus Tokpelaia sp.]|uniref:L,D-transpeptidase family protein n=1 Tax=Candidatus Tokpelaia sp. TaxID=2233777 RepID=UPI00123B950C|nr:L,D-transpeptidase family protein [Candidatus Tokpelaia sp.]KAA6406057.1 hypothetical protein DPQ22_01010 [Candidatus Tokpelaia sp.]